MSKIDIMDPVVYYAAGILTWASQNRRQNFVVDDLRNCWQEDEFDKLPTLYFSDDELLRQALNYLCDLKALVVLHDEFGPTAYLTSYECDLPSLSEKFTESPFWKAHTFGADWIKSALIRISSREKTSEVKNVPSLGWDEIERWEPLALDRGEPEVQTVFEKLDEAIRDISADNGFAAEFPAERDSLVSHAKLTLSSARDGKVTKSQVRQNLIAAGKWLAEKFSGTAIGTLGTELAKWGLRLLGLF